ncbi:MAG: hypothetical protein HY282_15855 [Nitrospirae bacterium]|nr:hypothetical protein [Candidatus Manganitrophaceae bacterium]
MNIKQAKICLDCDEIYDRETAFCPICSGRIGWLLRDWIGTLGREHPEAALSYMESTEDRYLKEYVS